MQFKTAIIIPARYGSTRFPGKPLARIAGVTMLDRVVRLAHKATAGSEDIQILVATDDDRIASHCKEIGVYYVMTPESCPTGSDRALAALQQLNEWPDYVINLQADAPFTPPAVLRAMIDAFGVHRRPEVVTPVHRLRWAELDALREAKKSTPFSGTTAILTEKNQALWFSKAIIPAIRNEAALRESGPFSPVWKHIGLYGFRVDVLEKVVFLPQSPYEKIEGLEQLRMIENNVKIQAVPVEVAEGLIPMGIDSPEDIERAEALIRGYGDPLAA